MSGYLAGISAILCLNVILAYAVFLPVATGQLNLGGAGFQAVGAYAAGFFASTLGAPPYVTLPISAIAGGLIAYLLAFPILRTRGAYFILATYAFAELVGGVIINVDWLGGAMGLHLDTHIGLAPIAIVMVAVIIVVMLLMQTRLGLAMRAVHDDETVAELMGINIRKMRIMAFTMGGVLAGLAGGLYAHYFNFVEIQIFDSLSSVYLLLFVLLGGTQTFWGPLLGASFFTVVPEIFRYVISQLPILATALGLGANASAGQVETSWRFIILGIITVIMMVVRPEGLITRTMVSRAVLWFRKRPGSPQPADAMP